MEKKVITNNSLKVLVFWVLLSCSSFKLYFDESHICTSVDVVSLKHMNLFKKDVIKQPHVLDSLAKAAYLSSSGLFSCNEYLAHQPEHNGLFHISGWIPSSCEPFSLSHPVWSASICEWIENSTIHCSCRGFAWANCTSPMRTTHIVSRAWLCVEIKTEAKQFLDAIHIILLSKAFTFF